MTTWRLAIDGFDLSGGVLLLGLFRGLTYAMLAIGLVLVYRSSKFINFAHIGIGLIGAAILSLGVREYGIPYWPAMVVGMAVSAGAAVVTQIVVVRPLAGAPRVLSMVATLGMAGFFVFSSLALNPDGLRGLVFPQPDWMPTFSVDALSVETYYTAQAIVGPFILAALSLFLWRSRYGVAIRGSASNADAAALAGASPAAMSVLSWGLAGAVACFSVSLLIPTQGTIGPESFGPDLLLRALAAGAIARFRSLWVALGAAVAIGLVEQVLATNDSANGYADLFLFVAVVVSLLASSRQGRDEPEPWETLGRADHRLPAGYRDVWLIRHLGSVTLAPFLLAAVAAPLWMSNSTATTATEVVALALVGLSVTLASGWAGELSLGQFAMGGIGCAVAVIVTESTGVFVVGLVAGAVAGGVTSAIIGLPALRVRGLLLAVATLSFALMSSSWLLTRTWLLGPGGRDTRPPTFELIEGPSRNYYWVALAGLVVALGLLVNLRRGAFGRKLEAVRDNEDVARAMSVGVTATKLQAYVVAGMLAGLGGAIYGQSAFKVDVLSFPVQRSIDVVVIAAVGGLGSLLGPVLGSLYIVGVPGFLEIDSNEARAGLSAAWLVLLTLQPRGLAGLFADVRTHVIDLLARLHGVGSVPAPSVAGALGVDGADGRDAAPDIDRHEVVPVLHASSTSSVGEGEPLLAVRGLTKRFGGLLAVDDVSFDVRRGETLGLIGPNGAGKTTTFELISGFVRPDAGTIWFDGHDLSSMRPEQRSRLGLARSFQAATLYPTLCVLDTVMVAREATHPSGIAESLLGRRGPEAERERSARELVELFGLDRFAEVPVGLLPTGTRRLVELACTVALEPALILLDEPSAGVAQSETASLARLLGDIRRRFGVTFVVVEHDMPLLNLLCDRMIAMETGRIIATGTPREVQTHPAVVESYLGTETVAVQRS